MHRTVRHGCWHCSSRPAGLGRHSKSFAHTSRSPPVICCSPALLRQPEVLSRDAASLLCAWDPRLHRRRCLTTCLCTCDAVRRLVGLPLHMPGTWLCVPDSCPRERKGLHAGVGGVLGPVASAGRHASIVLRQSLLPPGCSQAVRADRHCCTGCSLPPGCGLCCRCCTRAQTPCQHSLAADPQVTEPSCPSCWPLPLLRGSVYRV